MFHKLASSSILLAALCLTVPRLDAVELKSPADGAASANPFPGFTWSEHPDAFKDMGKPVGYEIQISNNDAFDAPVDQDRVALNRYVHDKPFTPGNYRWRVRAVPYGAPPEDWSHAATFTISEPDVVVNVDAAQNDLVAAVRDAVSKARAAAGKSVRIVMPPGDYAIDGSLDGPLFNLSGLSNVVIDGTGVKLRFANRKQGLIAAKEGSDLAVIGFDSSFVKGALRVQGRVHSIDAANRRITVSVDPGYPGFDASNNAHEDIFYLLNPNGRGRLKNGGPNFVRAESAIQREADGTWSFTIPCDTGFCQVGDRYGFNFRAGSAHLVDFSGSRRVTTCGLTNAGWGGMQFVSIEGDDFRILNCRTRFDGGDWMIGNADGVHIRGHATGPWIEGVRIQAIGDDAVALYARPASMRSARTGGNPRAAICKSVFFNLEPGDHVSFFQPAEGAILLETRVAEVTPQGNTYKVVFADSLPDGLRFEGPLQQATQIWNRSKSCGDFVIRGSEFLDIRRYGNVFRSRRGVVENNTYSGVSSRAIIFRNEADWPNGLYASQIIVRGNRITDSGFDSSEKQPPIAFLFSGYKRAAAGIGPRDILIENNTFERCSSPEIQLGWTRNAVVRDNLAEHAGEMVPAKTQARNSSLLITSKD